MTTSLLNLSSFEFDPAKVSELYANLFNWPKQNIYISKEIFDA